LEGKRVALQGTVYAVIPAHYTYSPFKDYFTVSLYPKKGRVKYLKFRSQDELERWSFEPKSSYIVYGCMHNADGKELLFAITRADLVKA